MKAGALCLAVALAYAGDCAAQTGAGQAARGRGAPPRNLQVLPKDTPPANVLAVMQQFTRALGVSCTYCHVEMAPPLLTAEEAAAQAAAQAAVAAAAGRGRGRGRGQAGPQMDYAADDKRQKQTARVMLALVNDVNETLAAKLGKPSASLTRVECATCHRGVPIPQLLPDLLSQTMLGKGEGAAVALYRELRQKYLGTGAYDFQESVLLDLGRQSLATRKPDDALAWLALNVEFYPQSAASYVALAQAHLAKRNREAAANDLEKALKVNPHLEPADVETRRLLETMRKSQPSSK